MVDFIFNNDQLLVKLNSNIYKAITLAATRAALVVRNVTILSSRSSAPAAVPISYAMTTLSGRICFVG